MNFTPQNGRILVKPDPVQDKVTQSGIIVAENNRFEQSIIGEVLHAGESGLSVGSKVLYSRYGVDEFEFEDTKYHVVSSTNILGIF